MIKSKIISAYEELAEKYNELIEHKPHNAYYDRPNTLKLIPDVNEKMVLDAACGPGKYAEILLSKGASVKGFDISAKMIELARTRNSNKEDFLYMIYVPHWKCLEMKLLILLSVHWPFSILRIGR